MARGRQTGISADDTVRTADRSTYSGRVSPTAAPGLKSESIDKSINWGVSPSAATATEPSAATATPPCINDGSLQTEAKACSQRVSRNGELSANGRRRRHDHLQGQSHQQQQRKRLHREPLNFTRSVKHHCSRSQVMTAFCRRAAIYSLRRRCLKRCVLRQDLAKSAS